MTVWVVMKGDYESSDPVEVCASEESAKKRRDELQGADRSALPYGYYVEGPFEVQS